MKAVEGLDLASVYKEVVVEEAEKAKGPIKTRIAAILGDLAKWRKEKETKEKELKKLGERIQKAESKVAQLATGDFAALEEPQQQQAPASTTEEQ